MPSYENAQQLSNQMQQCDQLLDSLFADLKKTSSLVRQLNQIKAFYRHAFNRTNEESNGVTVVEEYENFISMIQQVKDGEVTAEQALQTIKDSTEDRQADILLDNVFKVCELLFWVAASAACYFVCISVGIPMLFCEPFLGFIVTLGTAALLFNTMELAINCFEEFKTFDRINEEDTRERNLVGFFSTPTSESDIKALDEEKPEDHAVQNFGIAV